MARERELIKSAQDGDRKAFDLLIDECGSKIYNLAYRLTGKNDDAKDLWQESIIRAYENISKFRYKCSFSSWLYQITVNLWKDGIKNKKGFGLLNLFSLHSTIKTDDGEITREIADTIKNPASEFAQKLKNEAVWKVLDELDPKTRLIIVMSIMENKTYKEVSRIAGCSLRTVNTRVKDARKLFRQKFTKYLGENI